MMSYHVINTLGKYQGGDPNTTLTEKISSKLGKKPLKQSKLLLNEYHSSRAGDKLTTHSSRWNSKYSSMYFNGHPSKNIYTCIN